MNFSVPSEYDEGYDLVAFEKVRGSLSEERRTKVSLRKYKYNRRVSCARVALEDGSTDFSLYSFLRNGEQFYIQLSALEARFPDLTIDLRINLQGLTKSNKRLMRSLLIFLAFQERNFYFNYVIEEFFELYRRSFRPGEYNTFLDIQSQSIEVNHNRTKSIEQEVYALLYLLRFYSKFEVLNVITKVYKDSNIQKWKKTGANLAKTKLIVSIPKDNSREKVRRRGNRDTSATPKKEKITRLGKRALERKEVMESRDSRTLEEIKQAVLKKQLLLFEKDLDTFLQINDSECTPEDAKILFKTIQEHSGSETVNSSNIEKYLE